jgi:hypothetical protein
MVFLAMMVTTVHQETCARMEHVRDLKLVTAPLQVVLLSSH